MSTPSLIAMRIPERLKGKTLHYDKEKLPLPQYSWKKFTFFDKDLKNPLFSDVTISPTDTYIGIYVHWDGDSVIHTLRKHFTNEEQILNLLLGGFCSFVGEEGVLYYATRKEDSSRQSWDDVKPLLGTLKHLKESIYWHYCYVFNNGHWITYR